MVALPIARGAFLVNAAHYGARRFPGGPIVARRQRVAGTLRLAHRGRASYSGASSRVPSRLPPRVYANLTGCDLGWVREQGKQMLLYELSSPKGRLLLSILVLKDAGRNYYAVPGVDPVVSHESRHFADQGHEAFLGHLPHLLRVGHALVAAHCNVHCFTLPPFRAAPEPRRICSS